ncbi:MAG: peptidase M61, partial [Gelidibacter sp.]|nr:peptidase M61 [Gelidibacter sp.]
ELSAKYGKNKPFEDDNLIREISMMTYPSVSQFLETHVVGTTPINYNDFFKKVGLTLEEKKVETNFIQSASGFIFNGDEEKGTIFFSEGVNGNSFWVEQGVQPNDVIKEINGIALTLQNAQVLIGGMFQWKPGKEVELKLERDGKEILIKTELKQAYTTKKLLSEDENANELQTNLRKAWLKG